MLVRVLPKSNLERQREFRARNPGYFKRYRQKKLTREQMQALSDKYKADLAAAQAAEAQKQTAAGPRGPLLLPAPPVLLALPAPPESAAVVVGPSISMPADEKRAA